jgi:hypothetical protein
MGLRAEWVLTQRKANQKSEPDNGTKSREENHVTEEKRETGMRKMEGRDETDLLSIENNHHPFESQTRHFARRE